MKIGLIVSVGAILLVGGCASNTGIVFAAGDCPTPPDRSSEYLILRRVSSAVSLSSQRLAA